MRRSLLVLLSCLCLGCAHDDRARPTPSFAFRIVPRNAHAGQTLHAAGIQNLSDPAAVAAMPATGELTLRWLLNGHVVGSGSTLRADDLHRGDVVELQRIRRGANGAVQIVERDQTVIGNSAPRVHAVTLERSRENGWCLEADVRCSDADDDPLRLRYEWSLDGRPLEGALDEIASLQGVQKGSRVRVRVTATDGDLESDPVVSEAYLVDNLPPSLRVSGLPTIQQVGRDSRSIAFQALALDPDEDPLTVELLGAPRGARYDALRGTVSWTVKGEIAPMRVLVRVSDDRGASIGQWLILEGDPALGR